MKDEAVYLSHTLVQTGGMILHSSRDDRRRIAQAYQEAQLLVITIPQDDGDARPRIEACFERSDMYRAADDIACLGWMLTAIEVRIDERNLRDWETMRKLVTKLVGFLLAG